MSFDLIQSVYGYVDMGDKVFLSTISNFIWLIHMPSGLGDSLFQFFSFLLLVYTPSVSQIRLSIEYDLHVWGSACSNNAYLLGVFRRKQ